MSNLFRKEALENRSRALYGEVVLRGSVSSWVLSVLILTLCLFLGIGLFFVEIETVNGPVRVIDFLISAGRT